MKKNLLSLAAIAAMSLLPLQAQVRTVNSATNVSVSNSPAFIDASSNTTVNGSSNVGKGLIFPRVDLSAMTAFPGVTAGIANSFPTRFDGMIVYNTATSGTAGVGSTSGTLSPGYWYYENKTSSNTGGTWKSMGSIAAAAMEPWYNTATGTGATANTQDIYQMGKVGIGTATPTSMLHSNGSFATRYIAVGGDTTLDITHHTVNAVHNSGTVTLTLPPVSGITGRQYVVQNNGYGTTNVVVSGGGTIEGQTTFTMNQVGQTAQLIAGNTDWQLITHAIKSASVPSGANIYTADGIVSGNRTVNMNNNVVNFSNGKVGLNTANPVSTLSNTSDNIIASDGSGVGTGALAWSTSGAGYTAAFYNSQASNASNGVAIKVAGNSSNVAALDVSQAATTGTQGTSLLRVLGNGDMSLAGTFNLGGNLSVGGSINSRIIPSLDNTYDLGTAAQRWSSGFFGNTVYTSNLSVGGSVGTRIIPSTDNAYDLGTASQRWSSGFFGNTLYTSNLSVGGSVTSRLQPATDLGQDLGSASQRWSSGFINLLYAGNLSVGGSVTSRLQPATDLGQDLGSASQRWSSGFINLLYTNNLSVGGSVTSKLQPSTDLGQDLGSAAQRWSSGFINLLYAGNLSVGGSVTTRLIPSTDLGQDLGTAGQRWSSGFINLLYTGNLSVGGSVTTRLIPSADNAYDLGTPGQRWANVHCYTLVQASDSRLKTNILNSKYGLKDVMSLRPVIYNWKTNPNGKQDVGFIAQELLNIIPEAVTVPNNIEKGTYGVQYNQLIPVLTKAIQEQQSEIEQLKTENKDLKSEVEAIKKKLGL